MAVDRVDAGGQRRPPPAGRCRLGLQHLDPHHRQRRIGQHPLRPLGEFRAPLAQLDLEVHDARQLRAHHTQVPAAPLGERLLAVGPAVRAHPHRGGPAPVGGRQLPTARFRRHRLGHRVQLDVYLTAAEIPARHPAAHRPARLTRQIRPPHLRLRRQRPRHLTPPPIRHRRLRGIPRPRRRAVPDRRAVIQPLLLAVLELVHPVHCTPVPCDRGATLRHLSWGATVALHVSLRNHQNAFDLRVFSLQFVC
ncbi:hypothetical protein ACH4TX_32200 [Streptomyces sp. NPDC021098]|uniref:hypothetical protein n=1 Tax=unclassified Streptomyces TaxID=2593676 RepID=UPI0037953680